MSVKERLTEMLEFAVEVMDCPQMHELAEYLEENGVTILPEGAIILTREEIKALNEYHEKHKTGERK